LGNLTRAIYELDIYLQRGNECRPDLFCLFNEDSNFYYSLFEIKKRNIYKMDDIVDKIRPQYLSYLRISIDDLDDFLIPKIQNTDIYINYLFHNSDRQIIDQIINDVPIESNVYSLNLNEYEIKEIRSEQGNYNNSLMQNIINLSNDFDIWNITYIPFTYADIKEFRGKGGNKVDIHNNSGIILSYNFLIFLLSRKIRKESSLFRVDDFIRYVFQNNFSNLNKGWEERKNINRKFNLFLKFICDELPARMEINPVIERVQERYRILLRQTDTLENRINEIVHEVIEFLRQKRIPDFIDKDNL
jgi:hypothetical protein